jgi:hypothetical protein
VHSAGVGGGEAGEIVAGEVEGFEIEELFEAGEVEDLAA